MLAKAATSTRAAVRGLSTKPNLLQRVIFDAPSQSPLNEEFAGVPKATPAPASSTGVEVSTLSNGLRVASQDNGNATASVAVYFKAGSRYEAAPGTAHVLEHVAFNATQKRSTLKFQRDVEDLGAVVASRAGREVFSYAGESLRGFAPEVTQLLAEAITQPKLTFWEVEESKHVLEALIATQQNDTVTALVEGIHAAAFGAGAPLSQLYAQPGDLEDINSETLSTFLGSRFNASNAVVVGTNVDHKDLVEIADQYLAALPQGVPTTSVTTGAPGVHGPAKAAFIGGESHIRSTGGAAHVALALSAPSIADGPKAQAALGVLQALLGGNSPAGGAAGAPRLGPQGQSRIARSLHNDAHSFIQSLTSFAFSYSDAGMVGLVGSTADHESGRLVNAMAGFLKDAAAVAATPAELDRAKKAFKLALAAEVETRSGGRDAIGSQLLLAGKYAKLAETFAAVDAITAADVAGVAKSALASTPAISSIGSLRNVTRFDILASLLK